MYRYGNTLINCVVVVVVVVEKEILNEKFRPPWAEIGFFFLPRFRSTKQAAEAFFLAYRLIKSGRELSIHSITTVIHFSRAMKLYKCFYKIISRNYELRKF